MKEYIVLIYYFTISVVCMVAMYFALGVSNQKQLNCGVTEISPDYSTEDRQKCRELRLKQASQKHNL